MLLEALDVVINHRQEQRRRRLAADNFPDMQLFVSPGERGIPGGCISCHYYCMCPPPPPLPQPPPTSSTTASLPAQATARLRVNKCGGAVPRAQAWAECISNHLALGLSNRQSECLGRIFSLKSVADRIRKPRRFPPGCQRLPRARCWMIGGQERSQITNPHHKMVFIHNKSNRFGPLKGTRHLTISNSCTCVRRVFVC